MSARRTIEAVDTWSAQSRDRASADFEFEVNSFQSGRLVEPTYTRAEVREILSSQCALLQGALRKEQETSSSGFVALITALYAEGDRQNIALEVDAMAQLNKASSLSAIERAEQAIALRTGSVMAGAASSVGGKLAPMGGSGGDAARQLVETQAELRRVAQQLRATQSQVQALQKEKKELVDGVHKVGDALANTAASGQATAAQVQQVQTELEKANVQLAGAEQRAKRGDETVGTLRQELATAHREMQGRLSESAQFQGLKKIVVEKNALVKRLRTALAPHDPVAAGLDDEVLTEED